MWLLCYCHCITVARECGYVSRVPFVVWLCHVINYVVGVYSGLCICGVVITSSLGHLNFNLTF